MEERIVGADGGAVQSAAAFSREIDALLQKKRGWLVVKRLFDVVVSFLGILFLSPVLALIGVLVAIDSRGGPFFVQTRVGKNGKLFRMVKFRSMKAVQPGAEGMPLTVSADGRVTRVGKILRKTKLDELPQLLHVLTGSMSFVGPRPEVPKYTALYNEVQRNVLKIRPGITDLASIRYRNESDLLSVAEEPEKRYIREIMPAKIELNLSYMRQLSLITDVKLILVTLYEVVKHG